MNNLLAQIVLAQQRFDDGWMNILFVIVLAVFWMLGSIVKAMRTKAGDQQQPGGTPIRKTRDMSRGGRQQAPARLAQRPAGPAKPTEQTSGVPKKRSTLAELREAARRFAAEAEQTFESEMPKQATKPPKLTSPTKKPQIPSETKPDIVPTAAPIKPLVGKEDMFAQIPPSQHLSDLISDYTDPEKLRKAILHYEILGPPLSLRD